MKSINEPITVHVRSGVPCRLRWDRRTYRTRKLLDYWILQTRWWGREERRIYFRLETDGGVLEVYRASTLCEGASTSCGPREGQSTSGGAFALREDQSTSGGAFTLREGRSASRGARPPLPVEGDTHTREHRRTDAVYRPDVRGQEASRLVRTPIESRWMLSKIVD